jgi:hypothetical protein
MGSEVGCDRSEEASMSESVLQAVVTSEPWRQRVGYPEKVTDVDWSPEGHEECPGETIVRDAADPRYWHCRDCGYIGWGTTTRHRPVLNPRTFFERCRDIHLQTRRERGLSEREAENQMYHVMAVALRCAAAKEPGDLRGFLEGLLRL